MYSIVDATGEFFAHVWISLRTHSMNESKSDDEEDGYAADRDVYASDEFTTEEEELEESDEEVCN